jgi:uncharacterized protein YecE (DUF72 family)
MYRSAYTGEFLKAMAGMLAAAAAAAPVWCIFNNTAAGAAIENTLALRGLLQTSAGG